MDDIESVIAKAMLRYHNILSDMHTSENEEKREFSRKFFNLSLDVLNAIKKTAHGGLAAIGAYNTIIEFGKNLIGGWIKS